ncbi:unnamed protein product, partial [Phaeothamnion confervicola]
MSSTEPSVTESPPKGVRPIWLQLKNYQAYGLRRDGGTSLTDVKPYTLLRRTALLEEVQKLGFMSDFNDFKSDLEALKAEDVLLVNDMTKRYGEQWYFCYDAAVATAILEELTSSERAAAAGAAQREEEELRVREAAEAEAARLPIFENRPTVARPYVSATASETAREVAALTMRSERPLVAVSMCRPLRSFGGPYAFSDRDACDWLTDEQMARVGVRKYMEAAFTAYDASNPDRKLADSAVQAAPSATVAATQTTWHRAVNAASQYEATRLPEAGARELMRSGSVAAFLSRARPAIERALQMNETVDVFRAALAVGAEDEAVVAGKGEDELRELRTFTDLHHSKGRALAAIDGVPGRRGVVAVAPVRDSDFDERTRTSGHVERAFVLLWDFADLIHPVLKLESPQEVFCFRFNPRNASRVAAGCINGQVALWDVAEAMAQVDRRKKRQTTRNMGNRGGGGGGGGGGVGEDDDDERRPLPPLQPVAVSHIDLGHRCQVADLTWLPPHIQVSSRGQLLAPEHLEPLSHQFLTVAGDGQCLIWDVRFQAISEGLLPHVAKPRQADKKREDKAGQAPTKALWLPLFRVQLNRTEGAGELTLCRVAVDLGGGGGGGGICREGAAGVGGRSRIICTTEEGEIFSADWRAKAAANATAGGGGLGGGGPGGAGGPGVGGGPGGDDELEAAPDFVKWVARDHMRPSVALQKSPFFPDILLSVGDWSFHVWKADVQQPLFSSPAATTYLTTGRWSPTRPGTVFLGRTDGAIDVWDLTDSSYSPSITLLASPSRVTSMEFLLPDAGAGGKGSKQQLLAVGDAAGNLHVFDVPHNLVRPLPGEHAVLANFLHRELE